MANNNSEDGFVSEDRSSERSFFTTLPNIIMTLGLDPYEFRFYCEIKKIAGESGTCWKSVKNLAKECKMSARKVQYVKSSLAKGRPELGGMPLITITARTNALGDPDTDLITIMDLWPANIQKCAANAKPWSGVVKEVYRGSKGTDTNNEMPKKEHFKTEVGGGKEIAGGVVHDMRGVVHDVHQGGAQSAPKEEHLEEDHKKRKESQLANASRRRSFFLFEKIKKLDQNTKTPNFEKWEKDIDDIIRLDNRTDDDVMQVIEWTFNNDFWCTHILSARKLREKFQSLYLAMMRDRSNPKKIAEDEIEHKEDSLEKNKLWAEDFLAGKNFPDFNRSIELRDTCVEIKLGNRVGTLGFLEEGFQEMIKKYYREMSA